MVATAARRSLSSSCIEAQLWFHPHLCVGASHQHLLLRLPQSALTCPGGWGWSGIRQGTKPLGLVWSEEVAAFFNFKTRVVSELHTTVTILQNLTHCYQSSEFYIAFLCFYDVKWHPFISTQRTPFSISGKAGLMMNSLTFCLFGKGFISPVFLKDNFAWYRILA